MKDKEIACIHYIAEKQCDLGKAGTFYNSCQHCSHYRKKPGGVPARTDNRRKKLEKIQRKEVY